MTPEALELEKAIYLRFCEEDRALCQNTLDAYDQDLVSFCRYYRTLGSDFHFDSDTTLAYLRFLRNVKKAQPATVRRRMVSLRAFAAWLQRTGRIERSPFQNLELDLSLPRRLPRPVDRRIIVNTLKGAHDAEVGTRPRKGALCPERVSTTHLAIRMMVATGVRVGELTNIRTSDIGDQGKQIRIKGKGNRERLVFVTNPRLLDDLQRYLSLRSSLAAPETTYLLVNKNGMRLTEQALRVRLKRLSKKLGISPHLTPHRFRHSAATLLIEEGVDIRVVQRLLGHSSIATTELYTHVSDASMVSALQTANTLGKLGSEYA
ncbi:MAG: tyrosine-type recombinase/integrase [Paracoccaceae bacterium]